MKARLAFVVLLLSLFVPSRVDAAYFVLEGGINTQEQWHSAKDGFALTVVTDYPTYDIVPTVWTEPGLSVTIRIVTEKGEDPSISKGSGTFSWNQEGFWEFLMNADENGTAEVVVHMENAGSLPGKDVFVYAWHDDQASQSWTANISNGDSPMVLSGGINTPAGWTNANPGGNVDIIAESSFDVVGTVYSAPSSDVIMRIVTLKEWDPVITKGEGEFVWNQEGFWEITAASDDQGVLEVVVHSEIIGVLPGRVVIVSAWYPGQASHFWQATISNGQRPVNLGGGVNTIEQWHPMQNGSELTLATVNDFDIVPVINTDPGLEITVQVTSAEKDQDPVISRGTGSFTWNPGGYWEFVVLADSDGVVEVVIHKDVKPLPGETIVVTAWHSQPFVQTWTAHVSNGMYEVFLPLILR